jgi:AsmA protein
MFFTRRRAALMAAAVLVLLGAAVLALLRLDVNRYRDQVQAALAGRLHRQVSIGAMHVSVRPLGIRVDNSVIGEDPGFQTGRPFARADELYVSVSAFALLRGRIEVRSLELRRPSIEVARNAAGAWNFTSLGGDGGSEGPTLQHVVISGGEVGVTDLAARDVRHVVYQNIDLTLDDYSAGRPFDFVLAVTLPGAGAQRLALRGEAGPIAKDALAHTPFTGEVVFDAVSLSGLQQFLQVDALRQMDAVISGTAGVRTRAGQLSSDGSLRLDRARVRGSDIGYPITAKFDLAHDANTALLTIKPTTVRLDETPVALDGTVNFEPESPLLDLHVKVSDASIAETARLSSAFGIAFGTGTDVRGRMTADVRARGPATRPAFEGHVGLRDVTISAKDLPQTVHTAAVELSLTPREIRSNDFTATSNNTSVGIRFALADYTAATPVADATIRMTNAELGEALNVARAWGLHAADGLSGSGRLTANVRATGPVDALQYTGSAAVRDASVKTPSLSQPLRMRTADVTFTRNAAVLNQVTAGIGSTTAQGSLTVRNFASPDVDFQLSADAIDVAELQDVLAPTPQAQSPTVRADKESLLLRTSGSGHLRVGAIRHHQLLLENIEADARLDRGVITLQPLTASVFGGYHRGSISVDARRTPTVVTVVSDLDKVDANRLASATTNLKDVVYGSLQSADRIRFTIDDSDIAPSLNGTLSLNIPEGRIAHMDLMHEIGALARVLKGDDGDQQITKVRDLSAHFQVTNGVAHTSDLTAAIDDDATIGGTGSISLVNQALNLRLTAVLSREFSDFAGGTRVGGIMATVLANQRGELVVPMLVTGTMQQPQFAPDAERIAEMKLRNLVPDLRNPQKLSTAIEGIVGAITGRGAKPPTPPSQDNEGTQAQPAPQPEPKDPATQIEDALRKLLGGRKTKEQPPGK